MEQLKSKNLVVLTGAGMSAESGISTFRGADGLWEGHDIMEVASPQGWQMNRSLVLDFYNQRRKQLFEVKPNAGHLGLVDLEVDFNVSIVTQNVDNLHERAGSSNILHLHGELIKSRSTLEPSLIYEMDHWELKDGDLCEMGSQLRPHIVWFGEAVPAMDEAINITSEADILVIIGTSMQVYPAAGLIDVVSRDTPIYIIDPNKPSVSARPGLNFIEMGASEGVEELKGMLSF